MDQRSRRAVPGQGHRSQLIRNLSQPLDDPRLQARLDFVCHFAQRILEKAAVGAGNQTPAICRKQGSVCMDKVERY